MAFKPFSCAQYETVVATDVYLSDEEGEKLEITENLTSDFCLLYLDNYSHFVI